MLKKTITYTNFNDEIVTEDLYFHLTKADIVEIELDHQGGLEEWIKRVVAAEDGKEIYREFKKIILASFGKKSQDGKRFVKNAEIREEFESSEAFSELVMEILTDTDQAAAFVRGIVPYPTEPETKVTALEAVPDIAGKMVGEVEESLKVVTRKELDVLSPEAFRETMEQIRTGEVTISDDPVAS